MKGIIYARQSSGKEEKSESIEAQIENCKRLASEQKIDVVGVFSDHNISGKTYPVGAEDVAKTDVAFQNWYNNQSSKKMFRDGLGEVISRLKEIDVVIVDDSTRLYRPLRNSFLESYMNNLFSDNNVKILQVKGGDIDLSQFNDDLIQTLKNKINDEQILNQKMKARVGWKQMVDNGYKQFKKIVGVKKLGNKTFVFTDKGKELVNFIFDSILKGESIKNIVIQINQNAEWKSEFKSKCYPANITAIIKNPIYSGYMFNTDGVLIERSGGEGYFLPLSTWQKANDILNQRKIGNGKDRKTIYPFTGYVVCGVCGRKMSVKVEQNGKFKYICHNCKEEGKTDYSRFFIDSSLYPFLSNGILNKLKKEKKVEIDSEKLKKEKVELKERQKNINDLYSDGMMDFAEYARLLKKNNNKIVEIENKLQLAVQKKSEVVEHLTSEGARIKLEKLASGEIENKELRLLVAESLNKILVYNNKLILDLKEGQIELERVKKGQRLGIKDYDFSVNGKGENMTATIQFFNSKLEKKFGRLTVQ